MSKGGLCRPETDDVRDAIDTVIPWLSSIILSRIHVNESETMQLEVKLKLESTEELHFPYE